MSTHIKVIFLFILEGCFSRIPGIGQTKGFTVVIDAGHGGKTRAPLVRHRAKRHHASVAKKLGALIENHKDVKVIYTRKDDSFVALDRRAAIANNAKANLFISIHCNAVPKTETRLRAWKPLFWDSIE